MIVQDNRDDLPEETGVYLFYGKDEELLYIGKAKNIRKRVADHFASDKPWIKKIAAIDFTLLPSEEEALLSERELIASRRPRYNIRLRDDRSYPMIAVSLDEEYPRVFLTREERVPGREYFGPWTDARRARKLLETLPQIFPFRSCSGPEPGRRSGNPCLDYHIGLCDAPCVGKISQKEYQRGIERILSFLRGERKEVEKTEEAAMQAASALHRYEEAAMHRDRLLALRSLSPRQKRWGDDCDAIGVFAEEGEASVCILEVREGIIAEQRNFLLHNLGGANEAEVLQEFLRDWPVPKALLPGEAKEGAQGELLQLARKNAKLHLLHDRRSRSSGTLSSAEALRELSEASGSRRSLFRIEGYDVANIGGEHVVGSMVVFEGGQRRKSLYRTFRIDTKGKPDDYRFLEEMIRRRVAAWERMQDLSPYDKNWDASFAALPDLILVDGGKGQLSVALRQLRPFTEEGCVALSLAKKQEEVFAPDGKLRLLPTSQGSMLLQRVRDEAHRTSNARHQALRKKAALRSPLDEVPGVGPSRRQTLLEHFGSLDNIRDASWEEIAALPGISPEIARAVLRAL